MKRKELLAIVALGEDSRRQFKADVTNPDSLAADLVAFSNSSGGVILVGVADNGTVRGLSPEDVRRINQIIPMRRRSICAAPFPRRRRTCRYPAGGW